MFSIHATVQVDAEFVDSLQKKLDEIHGINRRQSRLHQTEQEQAYRELEEIITDNLDLDIS